MPAGGGRQAMNHVYNVAPADGTAFGTTLRNIAFDPLFGEEATRIDANKLSWIGSLNSEVSVCVAWHTAPFRTVADLRKAEILMGSSGPTSSDTIQARLLNRIAGTKMRLVHGYKGSGEVHIAMERGEVQGRCGLGWDSIVSRYQHWIKDKQGGGAGAICAAKASRHSERHLDPRSRAESRGQAARRRHAGSAGDGPAVSLRRPMCRRIACRRCAAPSTRPPRTLNSWPT